MPRGHQIERRRRLKAAATRVLAFLGALSASGTMTAALAADPAAICGRGGGVSQLLLDLQKPTADRLWRDTKLFVMRDRDDGSLWAFSIKNSTVHPAVRCRRVISEGSGKRVEVGQLCPAAETACASFAAQADERFDEFAAAGPPAAGAGGAPR